MARIIDWRGSAPLGRDDWCRTLPMCAPAFYRKCYGAAEEFNPSGIMSATTYAGWDVDVFFAGTLVMQDEIGGVLGFVGGAAATNGVQMQMEGEAWLPAAGKDMWFEAKIRCQDADDLDWFVGLATTSANVWTAVPNEIIGFRGDDGDLNIDFHVRDGGVGAQADTGSDTADGVFVRVGFFVDGITKVVPYINGTALTAVTANIPTAETTLTIGMRNGATTANQVFSIDWYRAIQLR